MQVENHPGYVLAALLQVHDRWSWALWGVLQHTPPDNAANEGRSLTRYKGNLIRPFPAPRATNAGDVWPSTVYESRGQNKKKGKRKRAGLRRVFQGCRVSKPAAVQLDAPRCLRHAEERQTLVRLPGPGRILRATSLSLSGGLPRRYCLSSTPTPWRYCVGVIFATVYSDKDRTLASLNVLRSPPIRGGRSGEWSADRGARCESPPLLAVGRLSCSAARCLQKRDATTFLLRKERPAEPTEPALFYDFLFHSFASFFLLFFVQ